MRILRGFSLKSRSCRSEITINRGARSTGLRDSFLCRALISTIGERMSKHLLLLCLSAALLSLKSFAVTPGVSACALLPSAELERQQSAHFISTQATAHDDGNL